MYTRCISRLAGSVLVSFLFSGEVGGFTGNMMAALCIFAGLMAGGALWNIDCRYKPRQLRGGAHLGKRR